MAYVLGFFAADGYITINRRGGQFWCIQITDGGLLRKIRRAVGSGHKIGVRPGEGRNSAIYRLQIGSIEMCDDLRRLGMAENKTKSLSVPNIPTEYLAHFVRGYFDGDGNVWVGHVHKERAKPLLVIRVVFTSCSGIFLQRLRDRLSDTKIGGGVFREGKGGYFRLSYSVHSSLKLYDFMYNQKTKLGGLFLSRKGKVFETYKSKRL